MAPCNHSTWLHISGTHELAVHDEGRFTRLLDDLTDATTQRPSMLLFVGQQAKNTALRELFPFNSFKGKRSVDGVNLRLDTTTISSDYPIFIADSDPKLKISSTSSQWPCHDVKSYRMQWECPPQFAISDCMYARLLFPFTDVICVFADDFNSPTNVIDLLKSWAAAGSASHLPYLIRPKIVVVVTGDEASVTFNVLQAQDFKFGLGQQDLMKFFSSIVILYLTEAPISSLARHRRLKEVLLRNADEMRHLRQQSRLLYSAIHFDRLFGEAVRHVSLTFKKSFNFVEASRLWNPIHDEYSEHLSTFVRLADHHKISSEDQASFLASGMLMDAYPPGMHSWFITHTAWTSYLFSVLGFDPTTVFNILYQPPLFRALTGHCTTTSAVQQCQRVRHHFGIWTSMLSEQKIGAALVHRGNTLRAFTRWALLKSNLTCIYCLRRRPEHILSCGHAICDICLRIFGQPISPRGYQFVLHRCILCSSGTITAGFKPPTAGIRILSIDGGGVRGVVPLTFLELLQKTIGPQPPLQDLFDLAFGTSSGGITHDLFHFRMTDILSLGGLIVLSLFDCGWNISRYSEVFETLSRQFFRREHTGYLPLLRYFRHLLKYCFSDGYYDVRRLEASLKDNFGADQRMFDYRHRTTDAKIAVTATTISDASPYLFSNYNGISKRPKDCGAILILGFPGET